MSESIDENINSSQLSTIIWIIDLLRQAPSVIYKRLIQVLSFHIIKGSLVSSNLYFIEEDQNQYTICVVTIIIFNYIMTSTITAEITTL